MSVQIQNKYDSTQPVHVTLDLSILNNGEGNNTKQQDLRFSETRNGSLVGCASNYYLSVIRFQLQTLSLMQFIPEIDITQNILSFDHNQTIYKYNFEYNDHGVITKSPQYTLRYVPQNEITQPNIPFNFQPIESHYYDVIDLQSWFFNMNEQIDNNFTDFYTSLLLIPTRPNPPFFKLSSQTGIVTVNANSIFDDLRTPDVTFNFNVNQAFYNLMATLPWFKRTSEYKLTFPNYQASLSVVETESHSSVKQLFNPIVELVFTTSLFPVVPAQSSPPIEFGKVKRLLNNNDVRDNLTPIITDFIVPVSQTNQYNPMVSYEPSNEYRLVDLIGDSGLSRIDIEVFWRDKFGSLHNLQIEAGAWGSLKILFRRKDFNNISLNNL